MRNDNEIEELIAYLEKIKSKPNLSITIIPPHIEEIAGTCDGKVYGVRRSVIEIEERGLYVKNDVEIFGGWKKGDEAIE